MKRLISCLFAAASFLQAQTSPAIHEPNWKQICDKAIAVPLTPPSFTDQEPEKSLQKCDSTALYYGFGKAPDAAAALRCGYYQRAHPQPGVGDPLFGPGVLTMLYANGRGVERNYNLAIRFACENTWAAQAEMELRIGHLERLRDTAATSSKFDLCDDATSGLMEGSCEFIQQQYSQAKRTQQLNAISAGWAAAVKGGFKTLQGDEEAFEAARTRKELDLSGTGRAAFSLHEEGMLRDQFMINLQRFARGDVPPASAADYQTADRGLNEVYGRIMRSPDNMWAGTVKPPGIRETEMTWLKLRDAWVEFARIAYPRLSADTVRTQITRLRVHQLQSLLPK